jgi:hypothetical protein
MHTYIIVQYTYASNNMKGKNWQEIKSEGLWIDEINWGLFSHWLIWNRKKSKRRREVPQITLQPFPFICVLILCSYDCIVSATDSFDKKKKRKDKWRKCLFHLHSKLGYHRYPHWFASDRSTYGSTGTQDDMSVELCAIGCGLGVGVSGAKCRGVVRWATSGRSGWGWVSQNTDCDS